MTTFKAFLLERNTRTTAITPQEAIEFLKKNCSKTLQAGKLYRGGPRFPISYGDSNLGEPRKSANTPNFYTVFLDNSPAWKDFPKRSRSFVGSTHEQGAYDVGQWGVQYMIPYDTAHVGICPAADFWSSFDGLSPDDLNLAIQRYMNQTGMKWDNQSWPQLEAIMKYEITWDKVHKSEVSRDVKNDLIRLFDWFGVSTALGIYEHVFKPTNFTHLKAADYRTIHRDLEVWVQGEAVFISIHLDLGEKAPELGDFLIDAGYLK